MIQDQIKIYKNYEYFNGSCSCCFKKSHLIDDCPKINYIPNKNFLVNKITYSHFQDRMSNKQAKFKRKYNSLFNLQSTQTQPLNIYIMLKF